MSDDNLEKVLGEKTVTFFGRTAKVKANFRLFADYKRLTGKGLLLKAGLGADADAAEVATLVWLVLGGEASGMTLDAVLDGLTRDDLPEILKLVRIVFDQAELTEPQKNGPPAAEPA